MKTKLLAVLFLIQGYSYSQTKESFDQFDKALNKIVNAYASNFDSLKGAITNNEAMTNDIINVEWLSKVNLAGCEKGRINLGLLITHSEWRAQIIKTDNLKEAKKKFNDFSEVLNDCTFDCCKMKRNDFSKSLNKDIASDAFAMFTITEMLKDKNDKLEDAAIYLDIRQLEDKSYLVSISVRSKKDNGQ